MMMTPIEELKLARKAQELLSSGFLKYELSLKDIIAVGRAWEKAKEFVFNQNKIIGKSKDKDIGWYPGDSYD
jgi:hypothetical protein